MENIPATGIPFLLSADSISFRKFFPRISAEIDLSDVTVSNIINTVEIDVYGGGLTSVDVYNGIVAVAVEGEETYTPGKVVFLDVDGNFLNSVQVGSLPDMVVFTHDGSKVLTANEGEPNADFDIDRSLREKKPSITTVRK